MDKYRALAFANGVILAIMVSSNSCLTSLVGATAASAVIFLVGTAGACGLFASKRDGEKLLGHKPAWAYLGGVIGIGTTIFQMTAARTLGVSAVVALALLGQVLTSLVLDLTGALGVERRAFPTYALPGLCLAAYGVSIMAAGGQTSVFALVMALLSGATVVLSRTANARLSADSNVWVGTLANFATALPIVLAAWLAQGGAADAGRIASAIAANPYSIAGAVLAIASVTMLNVTVPKIGALTLTQLSFVGQLLGSLVCDVVLGSPADLPTLCGSVLIAVGMLYNTANERQLAGRKVAA